MTTQLNISQVLALTLEELQPMTAGQLSELHSVVAASKQKPATRRADLIAGLIKGKKLEAAKAPVASEQLELVPVENSVKPKARKAPAKKPAAKKAAEPVAEEVTPEPEKVPAKKAPAKKAPAKKADAPAPDASEQKKAPKALKRKTTPKADLSKMSPEELRAHIAKLETASETFPEEIAGTNTTYKRLDGFDTVKDIQKHLVESPLRLYMFVDERLDDKLTQFLVLYVNENVIVLHDRNRQIDSTYTAQMSKLDADTIMFDKNKFKYSFYARQ